MDFVLFYHITPIYVVALVEIAVGIACSVPWLRFCLKFQAKYRKRRSKMLLIDDVWYVGDSFKLQVSKFNLSVHLLNLRYSLWQTQLGWSKIACCNYSPSYSLSKPRFQSLSMPKAPSSVGSGSGGATVLKRNQVYDFLHSTPKNTEAYFLGLPPVQKTQIGEFQVDVCLIHILTHITRNGNWI